MKKILTFLLIIIIISVFPIFLCSCSCKNVDTTTYTVTFMQATLSYNSHTDMVNHIFSKKTIIHVSEGNVVGSANEPNVDKYGYTFSGWYTDKYFNDKWNLNKDEVNSNLILYPKYVKK